MSHKPRTEIENRKMDQDDFRLDRDEPLSIEDDSAGEDGDANIPSRETGAVASVASIGEQNVAMQSSSEQLALRTSTMASASAPSSQSSSANVGRSSPATLSHQAMLRQQAHAPAHAVRQIPAAAAAARSPSSGVLHSNNNDNARASAATNNISSYLGLAGAAVALPSSSRANFSSPVGVRSFAVPEQAISDEEGSPSGGGANGWCNVETNGGTPPSARSLHAAALLNGVLYIFGGYDGVSRVNTFHAFSFAEKRWSPVLPSANSADPPSPRDRHVSVAFGNSFYVHGGFDGTSRSVTCPS